MAVAKQVLTNKCYAPHTQKKKPFKHEHIVSAACGQTGPGRDALTSSSHFDTDMFSLYSSVNMRPRWAWPRRHRALTGEEQPQLSSHALRDPLEDELLGLLRAVHAHALPVLGKMVLPRLLLQELFRLSSKTHTKNMLSSDEGD